MTFLEQMQEYFRGERLEAFIFITPAALVLFVIAGTALKTVGGGFGVGLAVPLVLFGLVAFGTGLAVGLRAPSQVASIESQFAASPKEMVVKELPRMRKVNANWPMYLGVWAVLVIVGVALRFGLKADWAHGVGPGLILVGALGFLIDGFAERRSRPYTAALEALATQYGVDVESR
jgi:predicted membrane channel-forming protein YqfA (hemolysin III family)